MTIETDPQLFSSGYERKRFDRYWTNPWMTHELFRVANTVHGIAIPSTIWECAAGRGDVSRALIENHRDVYSTDLDISEFDNSIGPGHERSFLEETEIPVINILSGDYDLYAKRPCEAIITNPPYGRMTDKFIRHGLGFFDHGVDYMAMLLRSEFRSGKSRADMFGECDHYMGELVLTTRPRWDYDDPNAPEKAAPRNNFSWYMWRRNFRREGHPAVQNFSYMPRGFKP